MSNNVLSRMRRYPRDGWIAGVCAGLAVHFDWNAKVLRIVFLLGLFLSGFFPMGVVYLLLWYLMDESPERAEDVRGLGNLDPTPAYARATPNVPPPTMADVKARFARMESRLRNIEESVTSNDYELRRELRKLES